MKKIFFINILILFTFLYSALFAKEPERIVSLKPNITEILFSLGVGDKVVGVTKYCDYPAEAKKKPQVADYTRPFLEPTIALKPDLVIGSKEESSRKGILSLSNIGINVLIFPFSTIGEMKSSIMEIAKVVGKKEKGESLVKEIEEKLNTIKNKYKKLPEKKVLMVLGHKPIVVAGENTYLSELVSIIGARNVVRSSNLLYPKWNLEKVMDVNPDVIIDMSMGTGVDDKDKIFWKKFKTINAVKNDKVIFFDISNLRASPRIIGGIQLLAEKIQ